MSAPRDDGSYGPTLFDLPNGQAWYQIDYADVKRQAEKEVAEEQFRRAVDNWKRRYHRRSLWRRLFG